MDDDAIFSEVQSFHQNPVVRVAVPVVVLSAAGAIAGVAGAGGGTPLIGILALVVVLPVLCMFMSLRTWVTASELRFEMRPLVRRRLPLETLDEVEAVRYNPIVHGGGWGVRQSATYGMVVNVAGNRGVRIVAGGKRYLIGSRRPEELAAAIVVAQEAAAQPADQLQGA